MDQPLDEAPRFQRSSFQQACNFCQAVFDVFVSRLEGVDGDEDYHCPECDKRFAVAAAVPPVVRLRRRRRDGRDDRYQETMF